MTTLEKQYWLFHTALHTLHGERHTEEAIAGLKAALGCTMQEYAAPLLPKRKLLTSMELAILQEASSALYTVGRKTEAVALAEYLGAYIDRGIINEYDASEYVPELFQRLSAWLLAEGKAGKALVAAEKGIQAAVPYGKLFPLPNLLEP